MKKKLYDHERRFLQLIMTWCGDRTAYLTLIPTYEPNSLPTTLLLTYEVLLFKSPIKSIVYIIVRHDCYSSNDFNAWSCHFSPPIFKMSDKNIFDRCQTVTAWRLISSGMLTFREINHIFYWINLCRCYLKSNIQFLWPKRIMPFISARCVMDSSTHEKQINYWLIFVSNLYLVEIAHGAVYLKITFHRVKETRVWSNL